MRGAFVDNADTIIGTPNGIECKIPTSGHGSGFRRAKVMRIDWGIFIDGERIYWTLTQKPDGVPSSTYNTVESARAAGYQVYCLAGGLYVNTATMLTKSLSPDSLWINDEQDIALALDPTAGVGRYSAYLNVLFLGVD